MTELKKIITSSAMETMNVAEELSAQLLPGDLICLRGDLGAGKTTFVKGLVKGFDLKPESVKSPTFVVMHCYLGRLPIYHFDFYRMESAAELEGLGMDDFFLAADAVSCLEWPEKIEAALPDSRYEITLTFLSPETREIGILKR